MEDNDNERHREKMQRHKAVVDARIAKAERDVARARAGWDIARGLLQRPEVGLVVLDELNIVLAHGYLELAPVLADLAARPAMQHVVVTGRGAPAGLVEQADTVSEVKVVKHAFKQGIRAQRGLEF